MITFIISAIRLGMALLLGSTGETLTEKSGHLNLGIPGIMCVGASCGCFAESMYYTSVNGALNPILAIIIPLVGTIVGGVLMGLIYCFLTVTLRANQNVTGLALTTFGVGVSDYMIAQIKQSYTFGAASKYFTSPLFGGLKDKLGNVGELLFSYGIMTYIAIAIALAVSFFLTRTRTGLHLRAVGENPATADAAGINVTLHRYIATCIGSAIAGLGGLTFIMDYLGGNWEYCIDAIGWLSVALVIFTVWKPNLGIIGSIIFGALYIASGYITGIGFEIKELFKMLPYVITVIVLIIVSMLGKRENQPPASLGLSYFREER